MIILSNMRDTTL